jgi:hypothetical protein
MLILNLLNSSSIFGEAFFRTVKIKQNSPLTNFRTCLTI